MRTKPQSTKTLPMESNLRTLRRGREVNQEKADPGAEIAEEEAIPTASLTKGTASTRNTPGNLAVWDVSQLFLESLGEVPS